MAYQVGAEALSSLGFRLEWLDVEPSLLVSLDAS
jgi:hypothetical protein